jgi:hypothetical protein
VVLAALACNDSSGPSKRGARLVLVAGANVTDTVTARPTTALLVEVHDSSGGLAPQGTVVRFTGVPTQTQGPEMFVEALTSTTFSNFATGTTDAAGRAGVLVAFGQVAGKARIAISVPTLDLQDTARYTVQPGKAVRITLAPTDTAVYAGRTFTLRGGVVDRFGNERTDPVTYTSSPAGVSVSTAGVVNATTLGRFTITATATALGNATGSMSVSIVPTGTLAAVRSTNGLRIVSVGLDGSGYRDLTSVNDGGIGPKPRWIPGTNTIVYSHYDGTYQVLRTVDQDGRVATLIANPPSTMTHQAEPSPAANAPVLYFSAYDSRCSEYYYCLHRSKPDGTGSELLGNLIATNEVTWRPAASPDGGKVAFVTTGTLIKVFDYASKTVSSWSVPGQSPSWSPDGTRIAYVPQNGGTLRVVNADGTNQRVVTSSSTRLYGEGPISWSSDSRWILAHANGPTLDLVEVATGMVLPLPFTTDYVSASLK